MSLQQYIYIKWFNTYTHNLHILGTLVAGLHLLPITWWWLLIAALSSDAPSWTHLIMILSIAWVSRWLDALKQSAIKHEYRTINTHHNYIKAMGWKFHIAVTLLIHKCKRLWSWNLCHCVCYELGHLSRWKFKLASIDAFKQERYQC